MGCAPAGLDRTGSGRAEALRDRVVVDASVMAAEAKMITQGREGLRYFLMKRTLGAAARPDVSVLNFRNSHIRAPARV